MQTLALLNRTGDTTVVASNVSAAAKNVAQPLVSLSRDVIEAVEATHATLPPGAMATRVAVVVAIGCGPVLVGVREGGVK